MRLPGGRESVARIYTRTGDDGTTGLIGGRRVSKDSPCIEACGSLDELNAVLGVVRSHALPHEVDGILRLVQDRLFTIGAELATPEGVERRSEGLGNEEVRNLEKEIDAFEDRLQPLEQFILPGGAAAGAALHLARAVARRAERQCVSLSRLEKVNPQILRYLNRLSDLCFVLARYINRQQSMPELHPGFGRSKD
jgi:cob(I)alamin adenosyltransferase